MMNDRDALMRAVCAHPDEDTPRLMLADWLNENGTAWHCELIRRQCSGATDSEVQRAAKQWRKDASVLLQMRRTFLISEAFSFALTTNEKGVRLPVAYVERGFVSRIICSLSDLTKHRCDIFARHPVRAVRVTDRHPTYRSLSFPAGRGSVAHGFYRDGDATEHGGPAVPFAVLPAELFDHLPRPTSSSGIPGAYSDGPQPLAALSAACVAWGRSATAS